MRRLVLTLAVLGGLAGMGATTATTALAAGSPVTVCASVSAQVTVNGQSVVNQSQSTCQP